MLSHSIGTEAPEAEGAEKKLNNDPMFFPLQSWAVNELVQFLVQEHGLCALPVHSNNNPLLTTTNYEIYQH